MLANIGIFAPVGFFPALLWRRWRWWKSLLLGFFTSAPSNSPSSLSAAAPDIDDVILNTAGALAGYWLFWLVWALFPNALSKFQCRERGDA